ncbi:MAG: hypothetical protein IPM70_11110 [Proteobacteria bacterium]|nr:hypothetical protein [Pseudomonadota bacterium]
MDDAEAQYQRAATLGGDARVRQGQERIAQIRRSDLNARDHARGIELEEQEQWNESLEHYRAVLARDDDLGFAADGLARSSRRAELDRELQDYLDRPGGSPPRPCAPRPARARAGRSDHRSDFSTGAQLSDSRRDSTRLPRKCGWKFPPTTALSVSVAPVGDLGSFTHRELELARASTPSSGGARAIVMCGAN